MRRTRVPFHDWLCLLVPFFAFAAPAAAATALTPEMVVDLRHVASVAVAPDGSRVAYTVEVPRSPDDEPGRSWTELWVGGGADAPRRFAGTRERIEAPAWSPGGHSIGFLSSRGTGSGADERTRLWILPAAGGEAVHPFDPPGSLTAFAWSPGGDRVAFVAVDPETEQEQEAAKRGHDQKVFGDDKLHRLWVAAVDGGTPRRWFDDDLDVASVAWVPRADAVVFEAAPSARIDDEYMFSRLYRVDAGGAPRVLAETTGKLGPLAVAPDGATVAWLGATSLNDPLAQSLFVAPAAGGKARNLTPDAEASAVSLAWLDADTVLLVAGEGTHTVPYRVDVKTGKRTALPWPGLVVDAVDAAAGSPVVAVAADAPTHPAEAFLWTPGASPRRVSDVNPGLGDVRLAEQEVVSWTAPDGARIEGVLTHPLDAPTGSRVPLVLQIHGGPEGTSHDGWTTSPLYPVQLLAAKGWAVLQPNYRGSGGRGVAWSKGDHDDLGGAEFDDVLAGIDALVARGLVDPARVGTAGWSYGGYLSAWAATKHSDRFAAAVVAAGLTNWISFTGTTDIPYEMSLVHWNQWWYDHPELHWERSPLAWAKGAHTPTLIVHGQADERVHPEQSLELYTALRILEVPTGLVTYPREPHGLRERAHRLDYIERTLAWFERYLAAGKPAAAH